MAGVFHKWLRHRNSRQVTEGLTGGRSLNQTLRVVCRSNPFLPCSLTASAGSAPMLQAADPQIEQCSRCGTEITGQEGACLDYEAWGPCCCDVCLSIIPISSAIQEYFKIILRNIYADRNVFLFYFTAETHYSRKIDWMLEWSLALNNSLIVTFSIGPTSAIGSPVPIKYSQELDRLILFTEILHSEMWRGCVKLYWLFVWCLFT